MSSINPEPSGKPGGKRALLACGGCLGVALLIGVALLAVGVSSGKSSNSTDSNAPLTSSDNSGHPPAGDVHITSCTVDPLLGSPSAKLTVVNHTSKASDYNVQVAFLDKAGVRIDSGYALESNVRPGQRVLSLAQGLTEVHGVIRCTVNTVDRTASLG